MTPRELRRWLDRWASVTEHIDRAGTKLPDALEAADAHDHPGPAAQSYDRARGAPGVSRPAEREALGANKLRPLLDDIRAFEELALRIYSKVSDLTRLPLDPKAARDQVDELAQITEENQRACRFCARTYIRPGVRRIVADDVKRTDCGGALDEPVPLCQWCRRFVKDFGRPPTLDELEAHHEGRRVRRPA